MEQKSVEIRKEQIEEMAKELAERLYNAGYRKMPDNIGDFSDGYHTFNELYHHRAVLFSVICNMFPDKAWKSKLHDTGDMFEGMFIVGIETEHGQATYHYDIEPYWDMFKVKELEKAPKWDGHTPSDAIERICNLPCAGYRKQSECISFKEIISFIEDHKKHVTCESKLINEIYGMAHDHIIESIKILMMIKGGE